MFINNIKNIISNYFFCMFFVCFFHNSENAVRESFNQSTQMSDDNTININNDIYYILAIDFSSFRSFIEEPNENIIEEVLSENPNLKRINSSVTQKNKLSASTLKKIYKHIKNVFLMLDRAGFTISKEDYEEISMFFEEVEDNLKNHNILYSIRKALYSLTGNIPFYEKHIKNNINYLKAEFNRTEFRKNKKFIKTIFWIIYSYNILQQKDSCRAIIDKENFADTLFYVFSYFYTCENLEKTYQKIRFNKTLENCFYPFIKSDDTLWFIHNIEKYNKNVNATMAIQIIKQKNTLVHILEDPKNSNIRKEITKCLEKISSYSKKITTLIVGQKTEHWIFKLFGVDKTSIHNYLANYIPKDIIGGIHANKFVFAAYSLASTMSFGLGYYTQQLLSLGNTLYDSMSSYSSFSMYNATKYNHPIHHFPTNIIPNGLKFFYPQRTISDMEYCMNLPINRINNESFKHCVWENKNNITFKDHYFRWQNMPGFWGGLLSHIPGATLLSGSLYLGGSTIINALSWWSNTQSILSFFHGLTIYYKYLDAVEQTLLYSKKLHQLIKKLYQQNNIEEQYQIREFIMIDKIFTNINNSLLNSLGHRNKNKISFYMHTILNFMMPGLLSYSYFKEIQDNVELIIQKAFVGSVDLALAKCSLLHIANKPFSIPEFIASEKNNIIFEIENTWAPFTNKIIFNSISFNNDHKNMMIVGPVASGKTMILSVLLTSLYLANIGIVPASQCRLNYFDYIIAHMEHTYDIGSGISQHLAERASMAALIKLIYFISELQNKQAFICIDEIYRGTLPNLAVKEAFKDLPYILKQNNIIALITTHFPQITEMTKISEYKMPLYYMYVKNIGNLFEPSFKLYPDNEFNWWIRDEELAFLYQQSYDKKNNFSI